MTTIPKATTDDELMRLGNLLEAACEAADADVLGFAVITTDGRTEYRSRTSRPSFVAALQEATTLLAQRGA